MARLNYNAGDKEVMEGFLLPNGSYDLKITEAALGESKNKLPMATVHFVVVGPQEFEGKPVKFHRVTFIPNDQSGAWIAKAFLKAIGQPYKGNVDTDTDAWIGKTLTADLYTKEYEGKQYNRLRNVRAYEGTQKTEEEVPF